MELPDHPRRHTEWKRSLKDRPREMTSMKRRKIKYWACLKSYLAFWKSSAESETVPARTKRHPGRPDGMQTCTKRNAVGNAWRILQTKCITITIEQTENRRGRGIPQHGNPGPDFFVMFSGYIRSGTGKAAYLSVPVASKINCDQGLQ